MTDEEAATIVIGAAIRVHQVLGPGFPENVYESALVVEFERREIEFDRQHHFSVEYEGVEVGTGSIDLLVENVLIVEIKAASAVAPAHRAQVVGYLAAKRLRLGLVLNFGGVTMKEGLARVVRERGART